MQYLLLIYHNESEWLQRDSSQQQATYREYRQLIQELSEAGKFRAGDQLKPAKTATTVRVRNGKKGRTDGPFAETKEQLGGYFLIDVGTLDEAVEIAARIPAAQSGSIEIREVSVRQGS